jgi:hypothetical protein
VSGWGGVVPAAEQMRGRDPERNWQPCSASKSAEQPEGAFDSTETNEVVQVTLTGRRFFCSGYASSTILRRIASRAPC